MNADKYTQKTIETINTAQAMAQENGNQYLTSEHLLYLLHQRVGDSIDALAASHLVQQLQEREVVTKARRP